MTTMSVVGECFFWYRLTRVVPDNFHGAVKRLCVCVCVCPRIIMMDIDDVHLKGLMSGRILWRIEA